MSDRSARFQTAMAGLVGVLALVVSGYTAYIQRQQVRAQVFPIMKGGFSSVPGFHIIVANKGVGPALIKHVVVTVDGEALPNWSAVIAKLVDGKPNESRSFVYTSMLDSAVSANETIAPLDFLPEPPRAAGDTSVPLAMRVQAESHRIGFEICYCSTLDDCWVFTSPPGDTPSTTEPVSRCPAPSARSFKQ